MSGDLAEKLEAMALWIDGEDRAELLRSAASALRGEWRPIESAPKDGRPFQVRLRTTFKWTPYKPDGQRQMRAKGRWQEAGEYGGWTNAPLPEGSEWAPLPPPPQAGGGKT